MLEDDSCPSRRFTHEQAKAASVKYFGGDELAADAFVRKYALRFGEDYLELTPAHMHARLAREFARIEQKYPNPMSVQEIFCLLADVDLTAATRDEAIFDASELTLDELVNYDVGYGPVIAQGSPMSAIGDPYRYQSLSNCFVIDAPYDSYGGICHTDEEGVQIMKRRGGVGHDVSTLRWRGASTKNAAGTSDGVTLFSERFSRTTREVAQGGRRGARMLTIDVRHPDIVDFINMKRDLTKVTGANVSVRVHDDFMRAVRDDSTYEVRFPCDLFDQRVVPDCLRVSRQDPVAPIWDALTTAAWSAAEPGVLFWDTILRRTPADAYAALGFRSVSTNPCAELLLCAYDSCRLMVVNVYKFVRNAFTKFASFDWDAFRTAVRKAQRLMDDLVDLEIEAVERIIGKIEDDPEPLSVKRVELELWYKIREKARLGRRTGLGPTGVGDCVAALGIRYGSQQSIDVVEQIYKALAVESYRSSCVMAGERGAFPIYDWKREESHEFLAQVRNADPELDALWRAHGRRNIANTTTAPNGTGATQAQVTSGIEPAFRIMMRRRRKLIDAEVAELRAAGSQPDFVDEMGDSWKEYTVYHHAYRRWMDVTGKSDPSESPWWGATASDVDWIASVELQGAAQRWVCHSISKTVNLPADASVDLVKRVFMRAWEVGCKGITVYRDGSRDGVLLPIDGTKQSAPDRSVAKRPKELDCDIHHTQVTVRAEDGSKSTERFVVLVGMKDGQPYEVFCGAASAVGISRKHKRGTLVKSKRIGGIATYDLKVSGESHRGPVDAQFQNVVELFGDPEGGTVTRLASLALRHGVPVQYVVEQLLKDKQSDMSSLGRVVARILKCYIPDGTAATAEKGGCPDCGGSELQYREGCVSCVCGWSKCS